MAVKRYAHIVDGVVVNFVLWDGESSWLHTGSVVDVTSHPEVEIGWTYSGGDFSQPE